MTAFVQRSGLDVPVIRCRELTGEFASAPAAAAVMAVSLLTSDRLAVLAADRTGDAADKGVLLLGLGRSAWAMALTR